MSGIEKVDGMTSANMLRKCTGPKAEAPKPIPMPKTEPDKAKEERREMLQMFFSPTGSEIGDDGSVACKYLNGITLQHHQDGIAKMISRITPSNVHHFLEGYEGVNGREKQKEPAVDHFFTQMKTEWQFENKEDLMRIVAKNLKTKFENSGLEDFEKYGKEIGNILKHKELSKDDAARLDEIVEYMRGENPRSNIHHAKGHLSENHYGSYR